MVSPILNDLPASIDLLRFEPYRNTLLGIIDDKETQTPLTIGIFAPWGAGKTSLMQMVFNDLGEKKRKPACHSVWFDAWKYDRDEILWRALVMRVLAVVRKIVEAKQEQANKENVQGKNGGKTDPLKELDDLEASLYHTVDREELGNLNINWHELLKGSLETAVHVGVALIPGLHIVQAVIDEAGKELGTKDTGHLLQAIERENTKIHIDHVNSIDKFQERFGWLIQNYVKPDGNLVVFIDDLDRCMPEKAISVLEAIKLFLDAPGCIFIIGIDQKVITHGIRVKYKDFLLGQREDMPIDGEQYLEKIIQLPFILPPIGPEVIAEYVKKLLPQPPDPRCIDVFAVGLASNPRRVKRAINVFLLLLKLIALKTNKEDAEIAIDPVRLAKLVAIQQSFPLLYDHFSRFNFGLKDMEQYFRDEILWENQNEIGAESNSATPRPVEPPALNFVTDKMTLKQILTMYPETGLGSEHVNFTDLTQEEIKGYFTLTSHFIPAGNTRDKQKQLFLPAMVRIPTGTVHKGTLSSDIDRIVREYQIAPAEVQSEIPQHDVDVQAFEMGKFPVTNLEYHAFIKDNPNYEPPFHWDNGEYPSGADDHPVVNVSYYDAEKYCKWLSEKTGEKYRLPTETEWERTARGDGQADFPFGDWDAKKCNTLESGIGHTSPMGQFSKAGDSPMKVMDLAGNVWEWTDDWFNPYPGNTTPDESYGERDKILRGGSFGDTRAKARCSSRSRLSPGARNKRVGFRCCKNVGAL